MESIIKTLNTSDDIYKIVLSISIDELEEIIQYTSNKYYNSTPVISDGIFDMLVDFLRLKKPKSKTLKMIGAPVKSKDKVKLPFYLGSMDKIKPPSSKLEQWKDISRNVPEIKLQSNAWPGFVPQDVENYYGYDTTQSISK